MSKAEHTPEPWKYVSWHIAEGDAEVRAPEGWLICCTSSNANARRIVACVNACAGIPDSVLQDVNSSERELIHHYVDLIAQRDMLVEALKAIVDLDDGDKPDLWHYETEFAAGRAALAAVEKQASKS